MAEAPVPQPRDSLTLRLARLIVRRRGVVAILLILSTSFFAYPIVNTAFTALGSPLPGPMVRIDTVARAQWPDHRFIHSQDKFAGIFGGSSEVFIALVVKQGSIFNPESLAKLKRITRRLDGEGYNSHTDEREEMREQIEDANPDIAVKEIIKLLDRKYPQYPVNHYNVQSLTHHGTRVVQIEADGDITSAMLMPKLPTNQEEADAIASVVRQNPPFIYGRLISLDEQGALIRAGFVTDRLNNRETFQDILDAEFLAQANGGREARGWAAIRIAIE